jgi:hypothetical protein
MMAYLPPVTWADVATKHDLRALEDRMDLRFAASKQDLHALEEPWSSASRPCGRR